MNVEVVKVGMLECNCYILTKDDCTLVIDPGDEYEKIDNNIDNKNLIAILVTHNHPDHIGALKQLQEKYQVEVFDSKNLEEKEYYLGPFKFDVINTDGHSSDSRSYYFKDYNLMFVGDFIFKGTIGRCDLPTGNIKNMKKSINNIKEYDDKIIIYPGHGDSTNLGNEKKYNEYFKEENIW